MQTHTHTHNTHAVAINEEMAEAMTPAKGSMPDAERIQVLQQIAKVAKRQGAWQLAAKKLHRQVWMCVSVCVCACVCGCGVRVRVCALEWVDVSLCVCVCAHVCICAFVCTYIWNLQLIVEAA